MEVIGVAAAGAGRRRKLPARTPVETARIDTITDGMGTRVPVPEDVADLRGTVTDVVLHVKDAAMLRRCGLRMDRLGLVQPESGRHC